MRRLAAAGAAALLLAGCDSTGDSSYQQFYQIAKQSLAASFGNSRITRDQAAAIPYASLGYRVDGGNENILVLATDTNGDLLWTSASHVAIIMHDGRIMRSVGLGQDLGGLAPAANQPLTAPAAALNGPFSSIRNEDFPDLGIYGLSLSCRAHSVGRQPISILGETVVTVRVDEACQSRDWSFVDSYWIDPQTALVWRSRQHIHPKTGVIETEILRPPG